MKSKEKNFGKEQRATSAPLETRRRSNRITRKTYRPEMDSSVDGEYVDEILANQGILDGVDADANNDSDEEFLPTAAAAAAAGDRPRPAFHRGGHAKRRAKAKAARARPHPVPAPDPRPEPDPVGLRGLLHLVSGKGDDDLVVNVSSGEDDNEVGGGSGEKVTTANLPAGISVRRVNMPRIEGSFSVAAAAAATTPPEKRVIDLSVSDEEEEGEGERTPTKLTRIDNLSVSGAAAAAGKRKKKKKIVSTPKRPESDKPLRQSQYKMALDFGSRARGPAKGGDEDVKEVEMTERELVDILQHCKKT